jgi:hypothetical protein
MTTTDTANSCEWKENEDDWWDTDCSNTYPYQPAGEGFKFCPYCGNLITETPYVVDEYLF